ncbi:MAG TPA: hypothetical protein VKW78_06170 [Terriglobales bacterium]|nr:hypothetical protein [Terriglobales bacterium]
MHVHEEVLAAANTVVSRPGSNNVFTLPDILPLLKHLNVNTVRTHVASRCCVNAPKNHPHKWAYFRRVGIGKYEILPQQRSRRVRSGSTGSPQQKFKPGSTHGGGGGHRDTIHVIVTKADGVFTAECVEVSVVTEACSMDELLTNVGDAIALHLEGENLADLGLSDNPRLQLLYEVPLAV